MPEIVALSDARECFPELVERAEAGEKFVISVDGVPRARLIPLPEERPPRKPGGPKGERWVADDFDDPLPPEILRGFYGEADEEPH